MLNENVKQSFLWLPTVAKEYASIAKSNKFLGIAGLDVETHLAGQGSLWHNEPVTQSLWRNYVSDLSNFTPRYVGTGKNDKSLPLLFTFSSRLPSLLFKWKAIVIVLAEVQPPWLHDEIVVMSWLKTPSRSFQSPEEWSKARSSAYAYFLEIMEGRSYEREKWIQPTL